MRAHTGIFAAAQVAIAAATRSILVHLAQHRLRGTWRMLAVPLAAAATLLYTCPHTATQVALHLEHA